MSDQIEEVKAKTDIVSIISEHIDLKKAGRNFKANCPFHSEKTPSFIVSPELQIYKCFGCQASGDVFSFLQEYEGMDFSEALKLLADRAGVKLKPFRGQKSFKQKFYQVNSLTCQFYNYVLLKHKAGKVALNYLLKDRGLKLDTIKTFKLGFSPDIPLAFKKFLIEKKKITLSDLESVGTVYLKNGRAFDRFRGRVIFPLHDHRGNICGFAGRILPSKSSDQLAKYINTPETSVYHKSLLLYGLNLTRSTVKKTGSVVVCEGELDMISSWQAGVKNSVAVKGTAITVDQVKLISRYAKEMIFALDTDVAGDAAAIRGIKIAENEGLEIKVAQMKGYKDPDDMARNDPKGLKSAIKNAVNVWDFIIDVIFSKYKSNTGGGKAKISREIIPILASIGDDIVQAHYVGVVSQKLDVPRDSVIQQVSKVRIGRESQTTELEIAKVDEKKGRKQILEERLLTVVFRYNPFLLKKKKIYSLISTPLPKRILDEFNSYAKIKSKKKFKLLDFARVLPKELVEVFNNIALTNLGDLENADDSDFEKEIEMLVRQLGLINIKEELERTIEDIQKYELGAKKERLEKAKKKFQKLTGKLSEFEEK